MDEPSHEASECPAAIITGGARRIGHSIAVRLHQQGFRVVVHYRHSEGAAQRLVAELNAARAGSAVLCKGDLSLSSSLLDCCEDIIDCSFRAFGRCDVLVNNASAYYPTPLLPGDDTNGAADAKPIDAQVAELFGSNAVAPLFLIRAFARRQGEGGAWRSRNLSVVNLCDAMTDLPLPGFCVYTMAKHALGGLTRAAALELAPRHIRVNAVAPGLSLLPPAMPQETQEEYRRKVPLGQSEASAAQIADAIAFLVSKDAGYITGTTLKVDGGLSLARA
ncbi:putative NAD(P)-dependent oxidoreductase [Trypanosoma cruzi]|uniref:Putative NAD(P)-dependent oxidoreductase n=1 Tax=Trypanosoma cruzi TaxID=5693 RepID=A0A2V2VN39_TRYCR|nr:pteridine reductase [Trypanosoma cruzi cruzi]PWU84547.1 putative NAD(P)-dependent oxidoreductase [Trypanosoma cruzi]PWU93761.1 putative NAD(P)-dependent oxidoreductase [Trypanosoma cruzi]PWU95743.1 putative NAD(P)-dependent oxidoreductase [Trypanosoma cruzi]PWV04408.1 putative NAD(P)-dependent oxidoreductase [Trypanosoma cruzi]